jgi:hypothetical protein
VVRRRRANKPNRSLRRRRKRLKSVNETRGFLRISGRRPIQP